jgi:hypothetical protein
MSRQTFSNAAQLFFGPVAYAGAYEGKRGAPMTPVLWHDFGAPITADANGVTETQSLNANVAATIGGLLASGGVATFDVPRNVVGAWTNNAVLTVTGTDQYGRRMVESSALGTSFAGKKAFKTVTHATVSANVTGLTIGTGDVLGLPVAVPVNGLIAARGANAADTGTFVPRDTATPTATTGDVRGTFDPSTTINGTNRVAVQIVIADPSTVEGTYGKAQYAG